MQPIRMTALTLVSLDALAGGLDHDPFGKSVPTFPGHALTPLRPSVIWRTSEQPFRKISPNRLRLSRTLHLGDATDVRWGKLTDDNPRRARII